jgi:uncharacterized protein (TIGR02594 family)
MTLNAAILETAGRHLGVEEWPGARHNPVITGFAEAAGHPGVRDDETPWCASFIGAVLAELGLPTTGSLAARSYEKWGRSVPVQAAEPGDVVVLWRGSPASWQGHVAFLVRLEGDACILRGGNQGNRVSDAPYPMSRIVAVRRAEPDAPTSSNRPVLRHGDRGLFVEDLQEQLIALRYPVGRVDRIFGDRTRAAVLAFQADQGLGVDGVVGRETWAALATAGPRPEREITTQDLREDGSRTIRKADGAQAGTGIAIVIGGITLTMESLDDALGALEQAEGLLERATVLVESFWPILLIGAVGVAVWQLIDSIKRARVEDARNNSNLAR